MSPTHTYQDPVAKLIYLENTEWHDKHWLDYVNQLGLTVADLPELNRLSWDEDDDGDFKSISYGIHALRASIQIDPVVGIKLYIEQLQKFPDYDWLHEEIYGIGRSAGANAIAPLKTVIDDSTQEQWVRVTAANGLEEIGKAHIDLRQTCIDNLVDTLQNYRDINNDVITSTLVSNLTQLKAVEAVDLIGEVFANTEVDEWVTGSWASVQVELGLKKESDFSPKDLEPKPPDYILAIREQQRLIEKARKNQRSLTELTVPARPAAKGFGTSKQGNKPNKNKKKT
jgi:hypothetical protein